MIAASSAGRMAVSDTINLYNITQYFSIRHIGLGLEYTWQVSCVPMVWEGEGLDQTSILIIMFSLSSTMHMNVLTLRRAADNASC